MMPLLEWVIRAAALACLVGAGAWALEEALRSWGRPTRFVWIGALLLSVALPLLALTVPSLWPDALVRTTTVTPITNLELLALAKTIDAAPPAAQWWSVREWLVAAWVSISFVFALRWLYGWWRLRRAHTNWRAFRIHGQPVYISDQLGPAVVGLRTPRVVLPAWLLNADDARLAMIVRHETEHARAGDPWLLALAPIAVVLFPWSPALWWQLRRLRLAIELDCDARVLRAGVPALEYGSILLDVAGGSLTMHPTLAALAEPRSFLERRIRAMTPHPYRHVLLRAAGLLTVTGAALFGATLVGAPSMQVSAQEKPPVVTKADKPVTSTREGARVYRLTETPTLPPRVIAQQSQEGDPIFVIDGVVQSQRGKLDAVMSKLRVGTIEVLKPEQARRRFGERGRFGAILVTTVPEDELTVVGRVQLDEAAAELRKLKVEDAYLTRLRDVDPEQLEAVKAKLSYDLALKMQQKLDATAIDKVIVADGVKLEQRDLVKLDKLSQIDRAKLDATKAEISEKALKARVSEPIFIIDGVVYEPGSTVLNHLDPQTIDSIEVIKGQAAVDLYGERGRSGVIFIKLKKP